MTKPLFSKSIRKHIRFQKARIRREVFDTAKRQELIEKLLGEFLPKQKEEKPKKIAPRKEEVMAAAKEK